MPAGNEGADSKNFKYALTRTDRAHKILPNTAQGSDGKGNREGIEQKRSELPHAQSTLGQ